jgi:hypothetical protein
LVKRSNLSSRPDAPEEEVSKQVEIAMPEACELLSEGLRGRSDLLL